jgi:hypothetical protein
MIDDLLFMIDDLGIFGKCDLTINIVEEFTGLQVNSFSSD